jgi:hypothetical protein
VVKRVQLTREMNIQLPRLELLAQRLQLDRYCYSSFYFTRVVILVYFMLCSFERKIILLLIGKIVSPVVRTLMDTLVS